MDYKVIGHHREIKNLQKAIREGNISHSYLFEGREGIGKLRLAKEFAKTLLCERGGEVYCDLCNSCLKFNRDNHPDFKLISGEGRLIKKAEIDEIVDAVKHGPFESDRKIFIINNAHLMNKESMNGLLKTLEEPPGFLNIILVTSRPEELLPTIRSRCQALGLRPLSDQEVLDFILENYKILPKEARIISKLAKGSLGQALKMLEGGEILELRKKIIAMIDRILAGDRALIYQSEDFFEANKDRIDDILNMMLYWFRDLAIYKETNNPSFLINEDKEDIFRKQILMDFSKIDKIIADIEETKRNIRANVNYPLSIEMMLLNIQEDNRW